MDESVVSSPGSVQYPEEDQTIPQELDFLPLPLRLPDMEKVWPGYETAGQLIGSEGLKVDKRTIKVTFGNDSQSHIGLFQQHSSTDLDGKLEVGFECGGGSGGFGELTVFLGVLACCNDIMDRNAGDQRTETITNAIFKSFSVDLSVARDDDLDG